MSSKRLKILHPYFRFCPYCGSRLTTAKKIPIRPQCPHCGFINYLNPTVGVAVIVLKENKLLLGKRKKPPFAGSWCIPCGHVEWGEDIREAAVREFREETGLEVQIHEVFEVLSNFHNPLGLTVGVWFTGKVVGGHLKANDDLKEAAFFPIDKIPVDMAFPTDLIVIDKLKKRLKQNGGLP